MSFQSHFVVNMMTNIITVNFSCPFLAKFAPWQLFFNFLGKRVFVNTISALFQQEKATFSLALATETITVVVKVKENIL